MRSRIVFVASAILLLVGLACSGEPGPLKLETIRLPDGFRISVYADDVPNARSMVLGEEGTLFVGTRELDRVYAVVDEDRDYRADRVRVVADGLRMPNGVAFRDGDLYVAEVGRVLRFDDIEGRLDDPPEPVVVNDSFPEDRWHGWKYIAFGPDERLYVPVGAPCNICEREDPYASITRMNPDGTGFEVFARGVRNTVGFDWHPETGELWFTDNGRDWLGDNRPPDELNRAPRKGLHFGFPYLHGRDILDPEYGEGRGPDEFTPPEMELGPHVAALGMTFYTGEMFPPRYRGRIFIAEHGSWNRTVPIGYRVMTVGLNEAGEAEELDIFADGWLQEREKWGRPVDVLQMPDGSLLVSDDYAGAIYRITYEGQ
ncbi:MAG: PQQ-dependent sugar dehydrogenase [Planctomycetota bacterium]